jgi:hypothetical protein
VLGLADPPSSLMREGLPRKRAGVEGKWGGLSERGGNQDRTTERVASARSVYATWNMTPSPASDGRGKRFGSALARGPVPATWLPPGRIDSTSQTSCLRRLHGHCSRAFISYQIELINECSAIDEAEFYTASARRRCCHHRRRRLCRRLRIQRGVALSLRRGTVLRNQCERR